jgi:hypothetical protein
VSLLRTKFYTRSETSSLFICASHFMNVGRWSMPGEIMRLRLLLPLLVPLQLWCGNTAVLFQPSSPSVGPFPTNALTVQTSLQKTGLQVNLPLPASCTSLIASAECSNTRLLNELDGFSINPRITVCFSGPVDVTSLSIGISILPIDGRGRSIGINQVIYDPLGQCAYAKPNHVLDQETQYLLVITSDVLDADGKKVKADEEYRDCVKNGDSPYCEALSQAIRLVNARGIRRGDVVDSDGEAVEDEDSRCGKKADATGCEARERGLGGIVAASLFTTLSATNWLQQARGNINSPGLIPGAGTLVLPVATFNLADAASIIWMPQTGISGVNYNRALPLNVLEGVDQIAFGVYRSRL